MSEPVSFGEIFHCKLNSGLRTIIFLDHFFTHRLPKSFSLYFNVSELDEKQDGKEDVKTGVLNLDVLLFTKKGGCRPLELTLSFTHLICMLGVWYIRWGLNLTILSEGL